MSFKSSSLLCIALLLALSSTINGFNITEMLEKYPELSSFNKYITESKLADQINSRNTITVLAVENGAISSISGKTPAVIKAIIGTHIILDYYDEKKLMEVQANSSLLTTLYQSTGLAVKQQGFVNVSLIGEGEIAFSPAGTSDYSELVKTVTTQPYNISILQITKPLIAPGVDNQTQSAQSPQQAKASPPTETARAPAPSTQSGKASAPSTDSAKAPATKDGAEAPAPAEDAKSPSAATAEAPAPSETAAAPSPAESPKADAPATADAPADGPAADGAADTASSSTIKMSLVGSVMAIASLLIVL
ncbi:fasciclin-like arabinogalactan protein 3 [Vigna umbellata]|uniref:fasciclin-like arabinogalactan protein 3 n=1 Tax=Vigna umbellata TaxID=87088 RepID=UPI001F5E4011|nr:fasciclin-like arabinogalactan protein 3 [Vigna umbellata]